MKKTKKLAVVVNNDTLPQMRPYKSYIALEEPTGALRKIDDIMEQLTKLLQYYLVALVFDMWENSQNCIMANIVVQLDENNKISTKTFTFSKHLGRLSYFINKNGIILEIEKEVKERLINELR